MPRAGLSTAAVVDAALAVVDEQGLEALTLTAVAARTGVAVPSLYKHVGGLGELRVLTGVRVFEEATARLATVAMGRSRDDAVAALMHAYRGFVLEHPARYDAMVADPLHDPAYAAAGAKLLEVFLAVLRGYGLDGSDAVHAVRRLRAVVHGFVSIEAAGGFGMAEDTDVTYGQLVDMYLASLPRD
ncbi:TetR-like C-terminal domain-containing protein [Jiangella alba]|uniref:DNA-binding transcriptional regulator, AcrR family n=1 Tax=Jiangella alba TaxID=561176 RepID=A0A1H5PJY8_9ACTN|nr:TetR-like C-terminal domain-containing protein [Jiangella alba]SEF13994.1 DNA-binding transcriptional regulator, AcrR family [Jiangella alba]